MVTQHASRSYYSIYSTVVRGAFLFFLGDDPMQIKLNNMHLINLRVLKHLWQSRA